MKKKELENWLIKHKCIIVRQGAGHEIWKNMQNNKVTSIPRHTEVKKFLAKGICKQLDISVHPSLL